MKVLARCLSGVLLCVLGQVYALSPAQALLKELSTMHTWQANFTQKAYDVNGRLEGSSSGHCAIKRPGYFYWRINRPSQQTIYLDPKYTWIVDQDLMQATRQSSSNLVTAQNPVSLLVGFLGTTLSHYHVSLMAGKRQASYTLIPIKEEEAPFQKLQIIFDNHVLSAMNVTTVLSSDVSIHFTQIKRNQALSEDLFHYTPKPDMDVLKQS